MLVHALVPKPSAEALDVRVLVRFAWINLPHVHITFMGPVDIAWPTNSGPLSLRMSLGKHRRKFIPRQLAVQSNRSVGTERTELKSFFTRSIPTTEMFIYAPPLLV
jgi:hypothetical protein